MSPAFWPARRQREPQPQQTAHPQPPPQPQSQTTAAVVPPSASPRRHGTRRKLSKSAPRSPFPSAGPRSSSRAAADPRGAPETHEPPAASPPPLANRRLKTISQQPVYPTAFFESPAESSAAATAAVAAAAAAGYKEKSPSGSGHPKSTPSFVPSPFRPRPKEPSSAAAHRLRRPPAARLWNPANSTPRSLQQTRRRRPPSPPLPTVPLQHPVLDVLAGTRDTGAGTYPLLTLSEQRQLRNSASTCASLQIERTGTAHRRISLPRSVRASWDGPQSPLRTSLLLGRTDQAVLGGFAPSSKEHELAAASSPKGKGKQKAAMIPQHDDPMRSYSRDLERGPDVTDPRLSIASAADAIGSAMSSSDSSIMGEDISPDAGEEWGPQHPCYPHLNPHVPLDSLEYATTRIIRVKRDWLIAGDLAPTFSNLYPEILDPAGVSEQEFRRVIEKLNGELMPIFNPLGFRNVLDSALGLVTGWLWDDFGLTAAKSRLNTLERWIDSWNQKMEKAMASEEGMIAPKLISLRQTGYMTLDIQIPDPEIAPAPSSIGGGRDSRAGLPVEPRPAIVV